MSIDVGTPGWAIDSTTSEFRFGVALPNGSPTDALSAAIESMDLDSKVDREMIYFQGRDKPQDRSRGQKSFSGNFTWGLRQYINFAHVIAAKNGIRDPKAALDYIEGVEFTFICIASPPSDVNLYQLSLSRLTLDGLSLNIDKSPGKGKVPFTFMDFAIVPVPAT